MLNWPTWTSPPSWLCFWEACHAWFTLQEMHYTSSVFVLSMSFTFLLNSFFHCLALVYTYWLLDVSPSLFCNILKVSHSFACLFSLLPLRGTFRVCIDARVLQRAARFLSVLRHRPFRNLLCLRWQNTSKNVLEIESLGFKGDVCNFFNDTIPPGGSRGLMVRESDSYSKGSEFESWAGRNCRWGEWMYSALSTLNTTTEVHGRIIQWALWALAQGHEFKSMRQWQKIYILFTKNVMWFSYSAYITNKKKEYFIYIYIYIYIHTSSLTSVGESYF